MEKSYALKQLGEVLNFEKEADFEDFIWEHLFQLLELNTIKRQHHLKGQFCDIIAVGQNGQPAIIEYLS